MFFTFNKCGICSWCHWSIIKSAMVVNGSAVLLLIGSRFSLCLHAWRRDGLLFWQTPISRVCFAMVTCFTSARRFCTPNISRTLFCCANLRCLFLVRTHSSLFSDHFRGILLLIWRTFGGELELIWWKIILSEIICWRSFIVSSHTFHILFQSLIWMTLLYTLGCNDRILAESTFEILKLPYIKRMIYWQVYALFFTSYPQHIIILWHILIEICRWLIVRICFEGGKVLSNF